MKNVHFIYDALYRSGGITVKGKKYISTDLKVYNLSTGLYNVFNVEGKLGEKECSNVMEKVSEPGMWYAVYQCVVDLYIAKFENLKETNIGHILKQ